MTYNCLIVDDERPALKLLTAYISKLPHLNLVQACENAMEAIAALQKHKIDLLFLDIQMPDLTGIELLQTLKIKPQVIFSTAYREYAVEGFELEATDYLVKPFSLERFIQAVNRATDNLKTSSDALGSTITNTIAPKSSEDYFFVKTNHKMERVEFGKILYLESMREYVSIHTTNRRYIVHQSMTSMGDKLPAHQFLRVHRSYMVGLDHIEAINGNVIYIGEMKIPVGASYRKAFFERIKTL